MVIKFTPTEYLILRRLGRDNTDIACELGNALNTVQVHVNNIFRKLRVHNRTQAVIKSMQLGILDANQFII